MLSLLPLLWIGALALLVIWPGGPPSRQAVRIVAAGVLIRLAVIPLIGMPTVRFTWVCLGTLALDLAVMAVLMGILHVRRLDLRWALLHAANPASLWMVLQADAAVAAGVLSAAVLLFASDLFRLKYRRFSADPATVYLGIFCLVQVAAAEFSQQALCWTLPLAVLRPGVCTALFYLAAGLCLAISPGITALPLTAKIILWLPLYMQLVLDLDRMRRCRAGGFRPASCRTVSVIVPALNEAERIETAIKTIRTDPAVCEVIVADGGSTDGTAALAEAIGARVVVHDRSIDAGGGRGGQIRAGVGEAVGDVIAIVHADTEIGRPTFSQMLEVLEKNPDVPGGAVGSRFDANGSGLRWIEWANAVRMAYFGIAFGDQVQFFRREPVVRLDLFPPLPLMEDVELSLRLNRFGRSAFLFGNARVSPRRWSASGYGNAATVVRLFAVYLFQRIWKQPDAAGMYRQYYRRKK